MERGRTSEDVGMLLVFSVMVSLCGADSLLVVHSLLYAHQIHQMYILIVQLTVWKVYLKLKDAGEVGSRRSAKMDRMMRSVHCGFKQTRRQINVSGATVKGVNK